MVAEKSNELHEPRCKGTYQIIDLVKYKKIESLILQVEYKIGEANKSDQRTYKKNKGNDQLNRKKSYAG